MKDRRLLTEFGAAELLGVTPQKVRRMAQAGQIPVIMLPGDVVRFSPHDLLAFLTTHRRPAVDELTTR